ncbi:hypothetical protein EG329_007783 [Mollisiaceae sp. DMI_Dod_QoI]|nr:hypothetical protein EG329_007783 [Helotiales sp. DMI_Dod_QoI]
MAPPPVTPSPHRFVVKKEASTRKSTLSQQPQLQQTPRPSTQQFNTTPRFTFSSTPRPPATQNIPRATPSASRYLTPAPKHYDAIDESSDNILGDIHDSIEIDGHEIDYEHGFSDDGDEYKIEERSPKRRRLSISSITSEREELEHRQGEEEHSHEEPSSSLPILSSPPTPKTKRLSTTAPKFLPPAPLPPAPLPPATPLPSASGTGTATFLKPPRFRPPDPAEQSQAQPDPLPEHFSPNRRGQKYVSGGLAAEVRDWLFNLESALPSTRSREGKEEWLARIMVDEVSGSSKAGFTMVRGRQIHAVEGDEGGGMIDTMGDAKVLLAGEGQVTGLQRGGKVEVGNRVGIKGPVWEVVVEGVRWGVGVDWKILS